MRQMAARRAASREGREGYDFELVWEAEPINAKRGPLQIGQRLMKALPFDLEEAAMIDGCTKWQAFRRVLLPLAAPGVFTTAILTFIHSWNEFIIALSMINDPKIQTATVAISKFTGATEFQAPFGEQMAAGVIVTVPLVIMVLIFQRRIVEGLTAGASK